MLVTGSPDLDFETVPNHFSFQILAVGTDGTGDRKTLTVLLTDVDEAPVFLDEGTKHFGKALNKYRGKSSVIPDSMQLCSLYFSISPLSHGEDTTRTNL